MSAGFPTNQLPLEFQQEHGTIDLDNDDVKPDIDGHGGVEDEDLALNGIERGVWLCKVIETGLGYDSLGSRRCCVTTLDG